MRKKILSMCLVIALIAGMAGVYFWRTRDVEEEYAPAPEPASVNLIQREEEDVAEIVFHMGGEVEVLRPVSDEAGAVQWAFASAPGYVLNTWRVRDKARQAWLLTAVGVAHENTAALELAAFGLEPPALVMRAAFYDGTGHEVRLGVQTADLRLFFMMIDDDPAMYLITATLAERMKLGVADVLDTSLPEMSMEVAYLRIAQRGLPVIELSAGDPGDPALHLPGLAPGAGDAPAGWFLTMLQPLPGMTLNHFNLQENVLNPFGALFRLGDLAALHPADLAPFGLDDPLLELEYRDAHGQAHLLFGDIFTREGQAFIYVKFAQRPHVFEAELAPVEALLDISVISIIERLIALIDIRDVERVLIDSPEEIFDMAVNHSPDPDSQAIYPTINGLPVVESDFRTAYRLLIGLGADAEVAPFMPQGAPDFTVTYFRIENPDSQLRFFRRDANFYYVSIDGQEVWFVSSRRAVDALLERLRELAP